MTTRDHLLGYPPAALLADPPPWQMGGYELLEVTELYPLGMPERVKREIEAHHAITMRHYPHPWREMKLADLLPTGEQSMRLGDYDGIRKRPDIARARLHDAIERYDELLGRAKVDPERGIGRFFPVNLDPVALGVDLGSEPDSGLNCWRNQQKASALRYSVNHEKARAHP